SFVLIRTYYILMAKYSVQLILFFALLWGAHPKIYAQPGFRSNEVKKEWWHIERIKPYTLDPKAKKMSFITVKGNSFVDDQGKVVVFKGVSISDPDKLVKDGRWSKSHFEEIKRWG